MRNNALLMRPASEGASYSFSATLVDIGNMNASDDGTLSDGTRWSINSSAAIMAIFISLTDSPFFDGRAWEADVTIQGVALRTILVPRLTYGDGGYNTITWSDGVLVSGFVNAEPPLSIANKTTVTPSIPVSPGEMVFQGVDIKSSTVLWSDSSGQKSVASGSPTLYFDVTKSFPGVEFPSAGSTLNITITLIKEYTQ